MWDVIRDPRHRRGDAAADHPVPRRGRRTGRPDRGHRPRPGHRRRDVGRAQGRHRRGPTRGDAQRPGRRRRPTRCRTVRRRARSTSAATVDASAPRCAAARGLATTVVRALDRAGIAVDDVEVHQPSLDDVFFALTGHPTERPASTTTSTSTTGPRRPPRGGGRMTTTLLPPATATPRPRHGRVRAQGVRCRRAHRAQPRAHRPRAGPAVRRHRPARAVHPPVRLRVRRRGRSCPRRHLRRLRHRRAAGPQPHHLVDGHGRGAEHRPQHRGDRPVPDAADVAPGRARRRGRSPTCPPRWSVPPSSPSPGSWSAGDPAGAWSATLAGFAIFLFFSYALSWGCACLGIDLQGSRVGPGCRTGHPLPAGHRLQRPGADPADAHRAAHRRRLEPGQRRGVGGPPALAEPEPVRLHPAWPMQHPIDASLLWSAALLAVFAPLATHLYRRRTTS